MSSIHLRANTSLQISYSNVKQVFVVPCKICPRAEEEVEHNKKILQRKEPFKTLLILLRSEITS